MKLSLRGAIRSAIADGGFHLYPAGRLMEIAREALGDEALRADIDPSAAVAAIEEIAGPEEPAAREVFTRDRALLCERLAAMPPDYDIEAVFDRMMAAVPAMARRYYGLDDFEAPRPKVVEYVFEDYRDL